MNEPTAAIRPEVRLIDLPQHKDQRGTLSVAEWRDLPFVPKRVFWITDVPEGETRGDHAHSSCAEIVWAVRGSFEMWTDDGTEQRSIVLDRPERGIYISAGVWCELRHFAPGTVVVVAASHEYTGTGYINDYAEYVSRYHDDR